MKQLFLFLLLFATSFSMGFPQDYNLGMEKVSHPQRLPDGWMRLGHPSYIVKIDSETKHSGKNSLFVEATDSTAECSVATLIREIPAKYKGKQITLKTYIKTAESNQNIKLILRALDNNSMAFTPINDWHKSAADWKQYSATIPLSGTAKTIRIGVVLQGFGKMWIDDCEILIDGKVITKAKVIQQKTFPAENDREFDNGFAIIFPPLNKQLIDDLELLGKFWGFLKYHHPQIGKGNYNWDYELFRILPEYLKAGNIEKRDQILLAWINKYGKIPICKKCRDTPSDAYLKPDLKWVATCTMSNELKNKIQEIYLNRHQGKHYYITKARWGNPIFLNENPYIQMVYPDAGFRLLALYRYWNMIQYFFPYKYVTDKNWNNLLKEYIPMFISARNVSEYNLATSQIIYDINDTHAMWGSDVDKATQNSLRELYSAPFRIQFVEQKWVVTDYYNSELKEKSGLKIGDIVTHINGRALKSIVDSVRIYYRASNEAARLRDISFGLLTSSNNTINIRYDSSGQIKQKELMLYPIVDLNIYLHYRRVNPNEKCYKFLNEDIGYITLANIKSEDIPVIKKIFRDTKGIIIDIRNYPSTDVRFSLGSYFVSKSTPFVKHTIGNPDNPGEFTFSSASEIPKDKETYRGKLVVIVNEVTQSHAEHTAMAFGASDNTTIIGSTTAGTDGNISSILLPGGLQTCISGTGVYYPDRKQTQRVGIAIDEEIKPTIRGIIDGEDELLERAKQIIYDR